MENHDKGSNVQGVDTYISGTKQNSCFYILMRKNKDLQPAPPHRCGETCKNHYLVRNQSNQSFLRAKLPMFSFIKDLFVTEKNRQKSAASTEFDQILIFYLKDTTEIKRTN